MIYGSKMVLYVTKIEAIISGCGAGTNLQTQGCQMTNSYFRKFGPPTQLSTLVLTCIVKNDWGPSKTGQNPTKNCILLTCKGKNVR